MVCLCSELPDDQVEKIHAQWFEVRRQLKIKEFYHEPDLQNVLDTHTNKLYESGSRQLFEAQRVKSISDEDAKSHHQSRLSLA